MNKSMLQGERVSTRSRVRFILEEYPEARNSDNMLCAMYWKKIDGVKNIEEIANATSSGAIRRARQYLNERGILLATDPNVLKRRKQHITT